MEKTRLFLCGKNIDFSGRNFMQLDPMTFTEFLMANGDENLVDCLNAVHMLEPLPDAFFNPLYEKRKLYYITGGMPESILMRTQARDVNAMQEALNIPLFMADHTERLMGLALNR